MPAFAGITATALMEMKATPAGELTSLGSRYTLDPSPPGEFVAMDSFRGSAYRSAVP